MTKLKNTIPRSLHLVDKGRQLIVFCLESKEMLCIITEDGKPNVKWSRTLRLPIGFNLYMFPHSSTSQMFPVPRTLERSIIKDAVFAEDGQVVVCGSDHGIAYVFSHSNGEKKPLQIMHHGKERDYLQVLDAAMVSDWHMVATGSSGRSRSVILWEKPLRLLEVKQLSKTEHDLANAKTRLSFSFLSLLSGHRGRTFQL
ncbi:hypothetical protein F5146DRAFT_1005361 [Armillaria mellea]|nr:hypothetical protein F5146DRAFT_1005361 [Armillaria mellea]